jgi:Carbonic anhydrase
VTCSLSGEHRKPACPAPLLGGTHGCYIYPGVGFLRHTTCAHITAEHRSLHADWHSLLCRVAGNVVSPHALGSILYAISNLGSRLVMVLGHTKCAPCIIIIIILDHCLQDRLQMRAAMMRAY